MTPFFFILIALAAYRLTRFLADDEIPFSPLRERIKRRWISRGESSYKWADALSCYWCLGAWVSFALVAGLSQVMSIPAPALVALAVSAVVGILGELVEWLK